MSSLLDNFFDNLIQGLFSFIGYVINLILKPITAIVYQFVDSDSVEYIVDMVDRFWSALSTYANWFISYLGLTQAILDSLIIMWIAILTLPLTIRAVKLGISWFKALKVG